jgi:predicted nucleic acid-binding protein
VGIIVDQGKRNGPARSWIQRIPAEKVLIPAVVFDIIDQGIEKVRTTEPGHAEELQRWRNSLTVSGMRTIPTSDAISKIAAAIAGTKQLKTLWMARPGSKKRIPQDIQVAATAIVCGQPIATLKTRNYLKIGRYFRLPGVFDLGIAKWRIEAPRPHQLGPSPSPLSSGKGERHAQ